MHAEKALYDFVMNYPVPCIYFDDNGVCRKMNVHSAEFFNRWKLECYSIQDICDMLGTSLEAYGKVLLAFGCVDYMFVPVEGGSLFMFVHRSISKNESMPFGIFVMDTEGKVVDHNRRCRDIFGHMPGSIKSFTFLKGRRPDDGVKLPSGEWSMMKALKGKAVEGELVDIVRKDGKRITVSISSYPLKNSHGNVIGSISYVQDACQYREAEIRAVESKCKAESCLKETIKIVQKASVDNLEKVKADAENIYKTYLIENKEYPLETVDVSHMLDAAGYECEKELENGTTILCNPEGNRLVSGNSYLKDAFKSIISNVVDAENGSMITIDVKDYYECGREYHRIEIKDELAEKSEEQPGLTDCRHHSNHDLVLAATIVRSLGGRVLADACVGDEEKHSKFIIILPSISCSMTMKTRQDAEGFAY